MNIHILEKGLRKDEIIFTAAELGEARAVWCGPPVQPGEVREAEFELPQLFMRWVDIVPSGSTACEMRIEGNTVVLTGILENIEEDGTGYLRLGRDLIMLECLGEPMALGSYVEIRTREIRLYPVNL
ncbi:hypothetical protein KDC22_02820 [Paenibacillus tritici]|uniref:hypothetical protein n=1 Tax=Paenibacillus tritici TaxID=1873425 RepID=UPI001BA6FDA7|nr:hypothetical protein [Paenibacillus tritici]QUL55528.1 hypothetical protein KDC22_02820 [Paenibacillus tritici]